MGVPVRLALKAGHGATLREKDEEGKKENQSEGDNNGE